jgi:hypothetical protein
VKSRPSAKKTSERPRVLYLYAISRVPENVAPTISAEGIDGAAPIEALRCGQFLCWVSRVAEAEFAHRLADQMQDLEWLATAGLRHQRAVAEISSQITTLPARFGTVFLTEDSLAQHIKGRRKALEQAFERVADADEWGIKIFAAPRQLARSLPKAASGADYLKRKAELLQPGAASKLDDEVKAFIAAVTKLAAAASPGGKASAGQPGLVWHGSFLIRRSDRKKLESALKKYAGSWKGTRRIDCSGPWPPYSFVEEHVH